MNKQEKIQEGQIQIDNENNYTPLDQLMVKKTHTRVSQLISELHHGSHIDDTTQKWLCRTPNPPRIPEFYTLTKINKPTVVGRPIISGCDGPTERLSLFVDTLIQPAISQSQASCLKNTTDFVNFIEKVKTNNRAVLVSMDVTSLYTSILQEEGSTVCAAYDTYYDKNPPIPNTT